MVGGCRVGVLLASGGRFGRIEELSHLQNRERAWFLGWINKKTKEHKQEVKNLGMGRDISSQL
jgi:hypothetical protein